MSLNSPAVRNPKLLTEGAAIFGNQCIVLGMDAKKDPGMPSGYRIYVNGGRVATDLDALEWAIRAERLGAGEIVLNSIDTDGVKQGFDLPMLRAVCQIVGVPVIASGGAGGIADFVTLFRELPKVDAGLAASIFHFGEVSIPDLKQALFEAGITVRR